MNSVLLARMGYYLQCDIPCQLCDQHNLDELMRNIQPILHQWWQVNRQVGRIIGRQDNRQMGCLLDCHQNRGSYLKQYQSNTDHQNSNWTANSQYHRPSLAGQPGREAQFLIVFVLLHSCSSAVRMVPGRCIYVLKGAFQVSWKSVVCEKYTCLQKGS